MNANIPINEKLNIPLTQTLTPRVYFDNMVPISTVIPVKETLKVDQSLPIDTKVQVRVLGKDITLPLKVIFLYSWMYLLIYKFHSIKSSFEV